MLSSEVFPHRVFRQTHSRNDRNSRQKEITAIGPILAPNKSVCPPDPNTPQALRRAVPEPVRNVGSAGTCGAGMRSVPGRAPASPPGRRGCSTRSPLPASPLHRGTHRAASAAAPCPSCQYTEYLFWER